jgi:hypothetical protein
LISKTKIVVEHFWIQDDIATTYQPVDAQQTKLYIHSSTVYAHDNYEQSRSVPNLLITANLALALLLGALGGGVGASSLASRGGWFLLLVLFIPLARRGALLLLGGFILLGWSLHHLAAAALVATRRSGLLDRLRRGLFGLLVLLRFFLLLLGLFATRGRCASNVLLELAGGLGVVILSPGLTGLVGLDLFLVDGQIIGIKLLPNLSMMLVGTTTNSFLRGRRHTSFCASGISAQRRVPSSDTSLGLALGPNSCAMRGRLCCMYRK